MNRDLLPPKCPIECDRTVVVVGRHQPQTPTAGRHRLRPDSRQQLASDTLAAGHAYQDYDLPLVVIDVVLE